MEEHAVKRTKQKEKAEASRQRLITAAARLFREKKIAEVGVREIATAAHVTTGTFYYHFKSKDDILDRVYLNRDAEFGELLDCLAVTDPTVDALAGFFRDELAVTVEQDGIDFTMHRMFLMQKKSTESSRLYQGVMHLVTEILKTGAFDSGYSASEITLYLFLMFRSVVYDWCITPGDGRGSLKEREDKAIRQICKSFV